MSKKYMYVSRWAEFVGKPGLALMELDTESGKIKFIKDIDTENQFNYQLFDEKKDVLYVCNEVNTNPRFFKGGGGFIWAFKVNRKNGELTIISKAETLSPNPCYLNIDPTGRFLICANHSAYNAVTKAVKDIDGNYDIKIEYDDATINLYELNDDGSIEKLVDVVWHKGLNPKFLLHSHPHCVVWDRLGNFFITCDKGEDKIYTYKIDYANKKILQASEPIKLKPFTMPRYCVFHPSLNYVFFNNEGNTNITACRYTEHGSIEIVGSASCIPDGMELPKPVGLKPGEKPAQQCIEISKDGQFLYDVINGKNVDGVSVFKVNQKTGEIERIQYLKIDGKWPRGVRLSSDDRVLVVSCIDGDGAQLSFFVKKDGTLESTGEKAEVPGGAFATFVEPEMA